MVSFQLFRVLDWGLEVEKTDIKCFRNYLVSKMSLKTGHIARTIDPSPPEAEASRALRVPGQPEPTVRHCLKSEFSEPEPGGDSARL